MHRGLPSDAVNPHTTLSVQPASPPTISVVIPAYNSVRWIAETLASVAAQTVDPDRIEVVVVDDGSTDETAEAAQAYLATTRLSGRVIRQTNRGPGAARNVGWRAAVGAWIQFLDADDLIDPGKIELQLRVAESAESSVAVIYSEWTVFGTINARWETPGQVYDPKLNGDIPSALMRGENAIATGAQLYSRAWLEQLGGWDEEHFNGEDHLLSLRVAFAGGLFVRVSVQRPLLYYRRHGPGVISLTTRSGRKNAEVWIRLAAFLEEQWRSRGELTRARGSYLALHYGQAARWLADYDWAAASVWIARSQELDPHYRPSWSVHFRFLGRVMGFSLAVRIAAAARKAQYWVCGPAKARLVTVPSPAFLRPEPSRPFPLHQSE